MAGTVKGEAGEGVEKEKKKEKKEEEKKKERELEVDEKKSTDGSEKEN